MSEPGAEIGHTILGCQCSTRDRVMDATRNLAHVHATNNSTSPDKMFKPFRPPLLKKVDKQAPVDLIVSDSEPEAEHRQFKKRKLLVHVVEESPTKTGPVASPAVLAPRKPLLVVKNPSETKDPSSSASERPEGFYIVLWFVLRHSRSIDRN